VKAADLSTSMQYLAFSGNDQMPARVGLSNIGQQPFSDTRILTKNQNFIGKQITRGCGSQ